MPRKMQNFLQFSIIILLYIGIVTSFNYLTFDPDKEIDYNYAKPELEGKLKNDLDFLNEIQKDGILTACLVLTRNNLIGNNINITVAIQNTKLDKEKVFDKIIVSMVRNCENNLNEKVVEEILSADNITLIGHPHEKYLSFDPKVIEKEPSFDAEDKRILRIIYTGRDQNELSTEPLVNKFSNEEIINPHHGLIDKIMMELEKTQTRYFLVGFLFSFVISFILYYLYYLLFKRKPVIQVKESYNRKKKEH